MPSPFPGMDPYLESSGVWPDFHSAFMVYCRDFLNDNLPDHYSAFIEERVQLVDLDADSRRSRHPDISIVRDDRASQRGGGGIAVLDIEAITITVPEWVEETQGYINVVRLPEHELVTST